jgi:hypothetical protein
MHDAPTANFTFAAMLGRTALTSESNLVNRVWTQM